MAADQAQIDTAKLNIAYCHIVAPVSGRVGLRLVDPGNYLQPSDTTGIVVITAARSDQRRLLHRPRTTCRKSPRA